MRSRASLSLLGLATALLLGSMSSMAVAEQNVPGSVLVWPYVDTNDTIISITNTYLRTWKGPVARPLPGGHEVCEVGPPDLTFGETEVHFIFFDGETCLASNFDVHLTAMDHATFFASDKLGGGQVGWMVAFAFDPRFPDGEIKPWNFDFLAGQAHVADSDTNLSWTYNAHPFLSSKWNAPFLGAASGPQCGKFYLDEPPIGNGNGVLNFNNDEYEKWADELKLPRLFEEANDGAEFDSLVALISPNNSTDVMRENITTYSVLFWNNDENENGFPFSRSRNFVCQEVTNLRSISAQFEDLGGTDLEQPTGWAIFDGYLYHWPNGHICNIDPPILGVFAQINKGLGADPAKHTGANNFFTCGFNQVTARIQYNPDVDP